MIWETIKYYPEYEINQFGQVKRIRGKKGAVLGRLLKSRLDSKGYPEVCLCHNAKSKRFRIHRLLAQTFIPNPLNKPCVNHIDGNRQNNALSNLEWVTKSENTLHGYHVTKNMKAPAHGKLGKYLKNPSPFQIEYQDGTIMNFGSTHECFVQTGICHKTITGAKRRGLKSYTFKQGKTKGLIVHF